MTSPLPVPRLVRYPRAVANPRPLSVRITGRLSGRARDGRLVHFATGETVPRPGDIVQTVITYAAPHHLNADGAPLSYRRTRAGDAFEAGRAPRTAGVSLGLPTVGVPAALPAVNGCAV